MRAPEMLPPRDDLAKLYGQPLPDTAKEPAQPDEKNERVELPSSSRLTIGAVLANLLVSVPYVASFVSIAAIYAIGGEPPAGIGAAATGRITIMALTVTALLPWLFALRLLGGLLRGYEIKPSVFVSWYLFFIFPVVDMSLGLRVRGWADWLMLSGTVVLSQGYVVVVLRALVAKTKKSAYSRVAIATVALAVVGAVLI